MEAEEALAEHLRGLEERLLQPDLRREPQEVARLLAEEFTEFGRSGKSSDRAQTVALLQAESPVRHSLKEFRVLSLGPGVRLVTYRASQYDEGGVEPRASLRSSVWILRDGRWQIVFHQGTPAPEF